MSSLQYARCSAGDLLPKNAVKGGFDDGPFYHARAVIAGKTIPGKVGVSSKNGYLKRACIPYGGQEQLINSFEVLISEQDTSYVKCNTGEKPPENAVLGGYDGGPSYHARCVVDGKNIPGKVGEQDGSLLGACVGYGDNEYRIHDFEVLVASPVEKEDPVSHVEFKIDEAKMLSTTPKVISRQRNRNNTSLGQSVEFSITESVSNSFTFDHQLGVTLSAGTEIKCGFPMIAQGGVNVQLSGSYSYTWGESGTTENSFTATFPVQAAPYSTVICEAVVNETKLDVPYIVHFESGKTSTGIWHGISTWGLEATFSDVKG